MSELPRFQRDCEGAEPYGIESRKCINCDDWSYNKIWFKGLFARACENEECVAKAIEVATHPKWSEMGAN